MRVYSEFVFPHLCDFMLSRPPVARQRQTLLAAAHGDVLEIGFGTGLNLAHYTDKVRKLTTVDPSSGMRRLAQRRIRRSGVDIDQRTVGAERLPFEGNWFDCAVSTFTLCSIGNVEQALSELYRVIKPDGYLLLLEHGLSPDSSVQKWQRRLNSLEMCLADGCHLDRNMNELVRGQPFSSVEIDEFYLEGAPRTHGYIYRGRARKD